MAKLMTDNYLAVGAAGTSAWERCATGLPSLNLILANNQAKISLWLEKTGSSVNMGQAATLQSQTLADEILMLATDAHRYKQMVKAAYRIVDGRGCAFGLRGRLPDPGFDKRSRSYDIAGRSRAQSFLRRGDGRSDGPQLCGLCYSWGYDCARSVGGSVVAFEAD